MVSHLHGSYNPFLVAMSFFIAVAASYSALDLARRVSLAKGWERIIWIASGSMAMGIGIWAMHFVAMLAYQMPFSVVYDTNRVVLSIVVAVAASLFALILTCLPFNGPYKLACGGLLMGLAISGMHYIGMSAIEDVIIRYNPVLFAASVLIATAASFFALKLAFQYRGQIAPPDSYRKLGAGIIMGIAIAGMHYTGMAAAQMTHIGGTTANTSTDPFILGISVAAGTIIILGLTLVSSFNADRRLAWHVAYNGSILESAIDCILIFDQHGTVVEFNPAAERTFKISRAEALGKSLSGLIRLPDYVADEHGAEPVPLTEKQLVRMLGQRFESAAYCTDGTSIPLEVTITRILTRGAPLYTVYMRDITDRQQAEKLIRQKAYHDTLTGLPNRNGFDKIATHTFESLTESSFIAVMFVDLDRFKLINDTLGHHVGDLLLQAVAGRLLGSVREGDTVSRLGGDEFIVLLPNADRTRAAELAQRMLDALASPFLLENNKVFVTSSIGIAVYPGDGARLEQLITNADMAMYAAKDNGKNNARFYEPEMNEAAHRKMELEQGLRKAFKNGKFTLHYQPKYNLQTGSMLGVEALVRWDNPELGMISPAEFIPLAEETGLIVSIGEWILREACLQNKKWLDEGYPPMRMAVNMSGVQMKQPNLLEMLTNALEESQLPPQYLELEITESVAMNNEPYMIEKLKAIRKLGVSISMDDFGTGYSSLSYLRTFPIDTLKIDRSFIRDISASNDDSAILRAIVYMAHSLKLNVLAEGIETEEQLRFLRRHMCNEGQGFLFSKPVTASQLELMLKPAAGPPDN